MGQTGEQESSSGLAPWDGQRSLKKLDVFEARLSRGFLRSRPEKWFPGFNNHWLPLIHSLGVEIKVSEVKPIPVPALNSQAPLFCGTVDDEPLALMTDEESARVLVNALCPGSIPQARAIILEYLARRCLTSLALSWSGPESTTTNFERELTLKDVLPAAAVKLGLVINSNQATVMFILGRELADRFDGLWRRQLRSTAKASEHPIEVHLELAQLAVPPSTLVEYLKPGAVVDLETPASDTITLRLGAGSNSKAWLPAKLCNVGAQLAFETLPGPVLVPPLPEGMTRMSIEFGTLSIDAGMAAEMSQVGAVSETGIKLGDKVSMVVNSEKVAEATLCTYEGRFAISVG